MTPTAPGRTWRGALPVTPVGIGIALPTQVVTNADWESILDTTDEWIFTRTGIRERRRAAPDAATSDLAFRAATAALDEAGLSPGSVDAVIVATTTPDHTIPQTAPLVAAGLGIEAAAFDVGAGCSGFVYGLAVAASLVTAEVARRVLLIGAETLTRVIDDGDRETAVLFGDGAGAVVLQDATGGGALGPFDLGADGDRAELLMVPAGGTRRPAAPETVAEGLHTLRMHGRDVYRHAVARMVASSRAVLDAAGLTTDDIDLLVGHQANARILAAIANRLEVGDDRCFLAVEHYGNTSAASIPLALHDALRQGRLTAGTTLLLTAFGAGLTWGSCLLRWPDGDTDRSHRVARSRATQVAPAVVARS